MPTHNYRNVLLSLLALCAAPLGAFAQTAAEDLDTLPDF